MYGEEFISLLVKRAYAQILTWKKNIFTLPRGKGGTDFIKELTRLVYLFVEQTKWERIALSLIHIFISLMLQKPSQESKTRDHAKYLLSRLEKWQNGKLDEIIVEGKEIQKRMMRNKPRTQESNLKAFTRLMLAGKIRQATKFINNDDCIKEVHSISEDVKKALAQKHPRLKTPLLKPCLV